MLQSTDCVSIFIRFAHVDKQVFTILLWTNFSKFIRGDRPQTWDWTQAWTWPLKRKLKKGKWVSVLIENKCLTSYIYFANSWFSKDFSFCIFILTSTITSGELVCFVLFFPPAIIDLVTFTQGLTLVRYWNSKNALVTFSLSGLLRNTEDLHTILFYDDFLPPENQHQ